MTNFEVLYNFDGKRFRRDLDLGDMEPSVMNLGAVAVLTMSFEEIRNAMVKSSASKPFILFTTIFADGAEIIYRRCEISALENTKNGLAFDWHYTIDLLGNDSEWNQEKTRQRGAPLKNGKKQY